MMKNLLTLLFLFFMLSSCKEKLLVEDTIEYYPNNSTQVYLKKLSLVEFDSVFYYYDNGQLFKSGRSRKNGKPYGIWKLHSKNGNLREIREWFVLRGHSRINRVWFLNKKGDTIPWRSQDSIFKQNEFINDTLGIRATCYDIIKFSKDTVNFNEPMRAFAYLQSPLLSDENSQMIVLIGESKNNFNSDFSNEDKVKLDTFYNLTIDIENQKWFKGVKQKYFTVFGYHFDTPGEKLIKGYMLEYATGEFENDMDSLTSKKYFEKIIFVRDSVN